MAASLRLPAVGQVFVDGMSNKYDDTFPPELEGRVDPAEFEKTITDLNNLLAAYWPCCWCFYLLGYGCCLCTAGLSLLAPRMCIADVSVTARSRAACFLRLPARWHEPRSTDLTTALRLLRTPQAEEFGREAIVRINARPWVKNAGLEWSLVKSCCSSAIHIRVPAAPLSAQASVTADQVRVCAAEMRLHTCAASLVGNVSLLSMSLRIYHAK